VDVAVLADDVEPPTAIDAEAGHAVEVAALHHDLAVAVQEVLRLAADHPRGPQVPGDVVGEDVEALGAAVAVIDVAAGHRRAAVERGDPIVVQDRLGEAGDSGPCSSENPSRTGQPKLRPLTPAGT
jgi:hypothetical protein